MLSFTRLFVQPFVVSPAVGPIHRDSARRVSRDDIVVDLHSRHRGLPVCIHVDPKVEVSSHEVIVDLCIVHGVDLDTRALVSVSIVVANYSTIAACVAVETGAGHVGGLSQAVVVADVLLPDCVRDERPVDAADVGVVAAHHPIIVVDGVSGYVPGIGVAKKDAVLAVVIEERVLDQSIARNVTCGASVQPCLIGIVRRHSVKDHVLRRVGVIVEVEPGVVCFRDMDVVEGDVDGTADNGIGPLYCFKLCPDGLS